MPPELVGVEFRIIVQSTHVDYQHSNNYLTKTLDRRLNSEWEGNEHYKVSTLTLSVTLGKLDFNLPATNPLPVQAVKSIFCITHIFKYAELLRVFVCSHLR